MICLQMERKLPEKVWVWYVNILESLLVGGGRVTKAQAKAGIDSKIYFISWI